MCIESTSRVFKISHTNLTKTFCNILINSDKTGNGCLIEYSNFCDNDDLGASWSLSCQEILISGTNQLSYTNYINNTHKYDEYFGHITFVGASADISNVNVYENTGGGYILFFHDGASAKIFSNCYFQKTYDGKGLIWPIKSISDVSINNFDVLNIHGIKCMSVLISKYTYRSLRCKRNITWNVVYYFLLMNIV